MRRLELFIGFCILFLISVGFVLAEDEYTYEVTFSKVPCASSGCVTGVESALKSINGVISANANFANNKATITSSRILTDADIILALAKSTDEGAMGNPEFGSMKLVSGGTTPSSPIKMDPTHEMADDTERSSVSIRVNDCNKIVNRNIQIKVGPQSGGQLNPGECFMMAKNTPVCSCIIDKLTLGGEYQADAYLDGTMVKSIKFIARDASSVGFDAGLWSECTKKGKLPCENGKECECVKTDDGLVKECNTCDGNGKICETGQTRCKYSGCERSEKGQTKCIDSQECVCIRKPIVFYVGPIPLSLDANYDWGCQPCDEGNECKPDSGRCGIIPNVAPSELSATCKIIDYNIADKKCIQECKCTDAESADECKKAAEAKLSGYTVNARNKELATAEKENVAEENCKPDAAAAKAAEAAAKAAEEAKHKECREKMTSDYACTDMSDKKEEDYWCWDEWCLGGLQCCISRGVPQAEANEDTNTFIEKIVKDCKTEMNAKKDITYKEKEEILQKALDQCKMENMPYSQYVPMGVFLLQCTTKVKQGCTSALGIDLEVIPIDCDETCNTSKCRCIEETCTITDGDKTEVIRWDQNKLWHITEGWNCKNQRITDIPGQDCSGNYEDGVCPRFCFFFNDKDCQSKKTAGYFLGDMITKFIKKQEWYVDFMSWVEGWSKWIDPQQWAKSWCSPANRKGDILISPAIYTDYGEPLAWYGGEIQIYNYTSTDEVSKYIYLITWGVGNLDIDLEYRISLMKKLGDSPIKAFPSRKDWFELDAGESHQGKATAKAFFLNEVYEYVCLEFNESVEGSARHCRMLSPAGEYRATGDPAVVEGASSTGGSGHPGNDNTINCELTGTC